MAIIDLFNHSDAAFVSGNMGASITGSLEDVSQAKTICCQLTWASGSTPVGTLELQATNDKVNFYPIATVAVSGSSGTAMLNFSGPGFMFARIGYNRTSGSATSTTGFISAKS